MKNNNENTTKDKKKTKGFNRSSLAVVINSRETDKTSSKNRTIYRIGQRSLLPGRISGYHY